MLQKHDEKNAVLRGIVNKLSFISNLDLRRGNCVTYIYYSEDIVRFASMCFFHFVSKPSGKTKAGKKQQSLIEQKPELKLNILLLLLLASIPELNNNIFPLRKFNCKIFLFFKLKFLKLQLY